MKEYLIYYECGECDDYYLSTICIATHKEKAEEYVKQLREEEDKLYEKFEEIHEQIEKFEELEDPFNKYSDPELVSGEELDEYTEKLIDFTNKLCLDKELCLNEYICREKKVYGYKEIPVIA